MKWLIFDLDGTLWDSSESVAESWNQVLAEQPEQLAPLTGEDMYRVMGKTMNEIGDVLFPFLEPARRQALMRLCEVRENAYIRQHGGVLFGDVRKTLHILHAQGYKLAIVSNCQTGYINAFLVSMDMKQYFCDYEEWGNTGLSKGENIRLLMKRNGVEPRDAVYIGDTQKDCDAADAAGIPFIHAAYGFGTVDHQWAVLQQFSELEQLAMKI